MFDTQAEVGRLRGVPVFIDGSFILLALLWGRHYFITTSLSDVLLGLWIIGLGALSILLHELAHAFAGRRFGIGTTHVELNGCGGLCHFDRPLVDPVARAVTAAAGPATNLALWCVFTLLGEGIWLLPQEAWSFEATGQLLTVFSVLASLNFMLFWFNLLPSHPLDGGVILSALLQGRLGYDRAMRTVAYLGLAVCAWLALAALGGGLFMLIIAAILFFANQQALDVHGGPDLMRRR